MELFFVLEQIDAIFQSLQFKHLRTSDPERLPHGMLPCAPAHVKMVYSSNSSSRWVTLSFLSLR